MLRNRCFKSRVTLLRVVTFINEVIGGRVQGKNVEHGRLATLLRI